MTERVTMGRRDWLRAVGRASLAAVLGGGVAALALRDGGRCLVPALCRGCRSLDGCALPNAVLMKQAVRRERDGANG